MTHLLPLALSLDLGDVSLLVRMLLPAGLGLVVLGLFMSLRNRRKRNASQPTAREQLERSKQTHAMRGDLEELMVEIERLTRRFASQIDTKTADLELLIREADQRIADLRQATADVPRARSRDPFADETASTAVADPLSRHIFDLADQGLAPVEIARKLNEHVGKVELILALRKTR